MKTPAIILRAAAALVAVAVLAAPLVSPRPAVAQGFETDSSFPANPESGLGVFTFDLVIRMDMASDRASGPITLFVNSRDGSMALENPHTTLWALGMPDMPDVAIHHVIFRPGEILACGVHPLVGEACMQLGQAMGPGLALMTSTAMAEDFYESVRWTDQDGAPDDLAGTRGLGFVHGMTTDGTLATFWFDPGRSTIATRQPFLGPGVGLAKDYNARVNRTVRSAFFNFDLADARAVNWMSMHLRDMSSRRNRVDVSGYRLMDLFSAAGLAGARNLGRQAPGVGAQVREFEAIGARDAADAVEDAYHERLRAHAEAHGLPIPR